MKKVKNKGRTIAVIALTLSVAVAGLTGCKGNSKATDTKVPPNQTQQQSTNSKAPSTKDTTTPSTKDTTTKDATSTVPATKNTKGN